MNMNDSEQIRKRLEEEYKENCSKIDELDEKIKIINSNDFETNVICVLGFSLIPWTVSIALLPTIIKSGIIPLNIVQPLSVGVPALIGITVEKIFAKKAKCREKKG